MPRKAPTACRHIGCPALIDKPGYCDEHKRDAIGWRPDRERGNRHARGFGTGWDRKRLLILKRDCGLCQPCLKEQRVTAATQVDHIVPRGEGGTSDEDNLQSICDKCHAVKTGQESARARKRAAGTLL